MKDLAAGERMGRNFTFSPFIAHDLGLNIYRWGLFTITWSCIFRLSWCIYWSSITRTCTMVLQTFMIYLQARSITWTCTPSRVSGSRLPPLPMRVLPKYSAPIYWWSTASLDVRHHGGWTISHAQRKKR